MSPCKLRFVWKATSPCSFAWKHYFTCNCYLQLSHMFSLLTRLPSNNMIHAVKPWRFSRKLHFFPVLTNEQPMYIRWESIMPFWWVLNASRIVWCARTDTVWNQPVTFIFYIFIDCPAKQPLPAHSFFRECEFSSDGFPFLCDWSPCLLRVVFWYCFPAGCIGSEQSVSIHEHYLSSLRLQKNVSLVKYVHTIAEHEKKRKK